MGDLTLTLIFIGIGVALFIIEMFTPGLGIASVLGVISFLVAVLLQINNPTGMLLMVALVLFLIAVMLIVFLRVVGSKKFEKNRLVLNAKIDGDSTDLGQENMQAYTGKVGTTLTALRPSGKAQFEDAALDVSTRGEFLPAGVPVRVMCVEGLRVVVQPYAQEV